MSIDAQLLNEIRMLGLKVEELTEALAERDALMEWWARNDHKYGIGKVRDKFMIWARVGGYERQLEDDSHVAIWSALRAAKEHSEKEGE